MPVNASLSVEKILQWPWSVISGKCYADIVLN